jgi:hypothetical protein
MSRLDTAESAPRDRARAWREGLRGRREFWIKRRAAVRDLRHGSV